MSSASHPAPSGPRHSGRLRVVVFTCGDLGTDVARALESDVLVNVVAVIVAPYPVRARSFTQKLRHVVRTQGWQGLLHVATSKLGGAKHDRVTGTEPQQTNVPHLHVDNFHSADALAKLAALNADLGVVAGTGILRESVFGAPRYGSINLHSGKTPEYRGSAPAFWELYNGESHVGITIHRVVAALDAGEVLRQEMFALNPAPDGDPMTYVDRYRAEVLRPNGIRLLAEVVGDVARNRAAGERQSEAGSHTYTMPDYRAIKELKRRVRLRRAVQ